MGHDFKSRERHMNKPKGFTLIELMITIAIIGVLASIAYPSYTNYIMKSRRASAQAHLSDIAQRQVQYLLDARAYAGSLGELSMTTPDDVSTYYTIALAADNTAGQAPSFTVTATPKAGTPQVNDTCGTLGMDSDGNKTTSTNEAGCW
jgi:type IV pilus assembly protein PilE